MNKMFKMSAAVVALLSASAAFAQASAPASSPEVKGVTRAEVLARAAERFDAADTNKDGVLSREEKLQERKQDLHKLRPHMHHLQGMYHGPDDRRGFPPAGAAQMRGEHGGPRGQGATSPPPVGEQH